MLISHSSSEGLGLPEEKRIQNFDWGTINWIWEPSSIEMEQISVCILSIRPNKRQWRHLQAGIKQVIHVIEGQGVHYINSDQEILEKGNTYWVPPAVEHEIVNAGRNILRLLIIYLPAMYLELKKERDHVVSIVKEELTGERKSECLDALKQFLNKLKDATGLRASFIDQSGQVLISSHEDAYCKTICDFPEGRDYCSKQISEALAMSEHIKAPVIRYCCSGMVIVAQSMWLRGLGRTGVICGPVFLSQPSRQLISLNKSKLKEIVPFNSDLIQKFKALPVIAKSRLYITREFLSILSALGNKDEGTDVIFNKDMLERQVKPHFMFNTLNVLAGIAQSESAYQTADLIIALAGLLRYQLRNEKGIRSIDEELKCVDYYIKIQELRLGDRLKVQKKIDPFISSFKIPTMILQNLVENAIQHGIMPKKEGGNVCISAKKEDNYVELMVEDDGVGIRKDKLISMHEMIAKKIKPQNLEGTGLWNLCQRLNYYFEGKHQLFIESGGKEGARVTIRFYL